VPMSGSRRPIALRSGALRALLRQPDLPPDLVAKLTERAGDLARAERERDVATMRTIAWEAVWRRLPIALLCLVALVVVAGIAYLLSPAPPKAAPDASTAVSAAEPVLSVPDPTPGETSAVVSGPTNPPQPAREMASSPRPVPTQAVAGQAEARPASGANVGGAKRSDRAAQLSGSQTSSSPPAPLTAPVRSPLRSASAPLVPAPSEESSGPSEVAPPATPVAVPTSVPLVEVPSQP